MNAAAGADRAALAALEALPFAVWLHDQGFRLAYANAAAWALLDLPRDALPPGTPLRETARRLAQRGLFGPGDAEAQAAQHDARDRSQPWQGLVRGTDGVLREMQSLPLPAGGGCCIVRELGDAAPSGEALARAALLETLLDHLDAGIALYAPDHRLLLSNPRYAALIGLDPGALRPGMTQQAVVGLLAAAGGITGTEAETLASERLGSGLAAPVGYRRVRPDGTVLQVERRPIGETGELVEIADITPLKRAEDEARRRAALIDGVLAALPHGVLVFDADQRVTMANAAYLRIMAGAPVAVGEHRKTIARRRAEAGEYGPGDPAVLAEANLAPPGDASVRRRRTRPDGTVLDICYAPLPDGGYVQVTTDITALQRAEATAQARAGLLQVMLDNMRHGIALFDADHRLVMANALAARLTGLAPEQLLPGRSFAALIEEQVAAGAVAPDLASTVIAATRAGARAEPLAYRRTRDDGSVLEIVSDPTPDGGFVVTFSDVTARARAEAEARERAELLQATIDHLRQGIIVYGADRRVRIANRQSEEIAGHRPGAIRPGRLLDDMVREMIPAGALEPGPEGEAIIAETLTYDRSRPTTRVRRARGGRVIEIHSDPLPDGGFIVSHIDITPLARAEEEARRRAGQLQTMLDNMRHGIALYGPDRRLLVANPLAASLAGVAAEDLQPGRSMDELVDLQRARGAFGAGEVARRLAARIKALDRSRHHQGVRRLPDGRVVESASDPTPDGGFVVTWSDVTARAVAEEAARRRAELLRITLDGMRHSILLYGPDRRLLIANRLAVPALGLPDLEQHIGLTFEAVLEKQVALGVFGDGAESRRVAEEVLAIDRTRPIRYQRRLASGRVIAVASDPTPDGGFVITHSDVTELVEAQAEASRRAALLQVMQDSMRHGIALYDGEHRLIAANRLAARLTGLGEVAGMLGRTMPELMHRQVEMGELTPDYAAAGMRIDRGRPHRSMRRRPDGTVLEITSDPTPDGGFIVTYSDVTALTRLEAEARRRADILQVMLDNMRHGIVYYGPDRRVVAANALAADLGGHPPGSVAPGRLLDDLILEQRDMGAVGGDAEAFADRALGLDRSRPHRYVRPHRDGRVIEVTSDPTPDGGFVVTMSDISALAEAEAEARRRAAIQQAMLDNIRHGILLVDAGGRVVAANRVFCQLLGMPEAVVAPGRRFTDFVDWLAERGEYGEGEAGAAAAAAIRDRDRSRSIRSVRTRPDGTVLEAVSDPTPDGGWVLTFTDVTAMRRAQAELERARDAAEAANRAKSRFLATMSHELRTPLNAVIGFSEALISAPGAPMAEEYRRSIHEAGRHLLSLIDDILDVTRAETTGFEVAEASVDLGTVAATALRVMGATAATGQVTLRAEVAPGLPALRADELRLRQVLLNLLSNAVKFTPAGGSVTLSAAPDPVRGGVTLRIADTGIGIRPEDIPRAFEPFTQLDGGLSRRFGGSGLGLYLSKALAAAQGAELSLESRLGEGTTAVLHFPSGRLVGPAPAGRG